MLQGPSILSRTSDLDRVVVNRRYDYQSRSVDGVAVAGLLFLCVANSARSQMAEGLARARFGDRIRVQSAGSRPSTIDSRAVQVMAEIGIDISGQWSKGLDTVDLTVVDTVVTLCADEVCPAYLQVHRQVHWALPDPTAKTGHEGDQLQPFRNARDAIEIRLQSFRLSTQSLDVADANGL